MKFEPTDLIIVFILLIVFIVLFTIVVSDLFKGTGITEAEEHLISGTIGSLLAILALFFGQNIKRKNE